MLYLVALMVSIHFSDGHAAELDRISCTGHPQLQKGMSARLQEIAKEDQADRALPWDKIDWSKVSPRDLARRIEVGEIFARGCFVSEADFGAAALVYQHGDTADHAYQAFVWSKRSVDLGGDAEQKWLMGAALDRYLTRIGQKQLFATQYARPAGETCFCLEPVEETFPDKMRVEYVKKNLSQAISGLKKLNQNASGCERAKFCGTNLKASPRGTVPGFW